MNILLLTTQVSPFQSELADAMNELAGVTFTSVFTQTGTRPAHWLRGRSSQHTLTPSAEYGVARTVQWLRSIIAARKPNIVLVGGIRGPIWKAAVPLRRHAGVRLGFWLEQPRPDRGGLLKILRGLEYRYRLAGAPFVLAIGDRAVDYYSTLCDEVALVPYGQDLSPCFAMTRRPPAGGIFRFLFSGQLIARHNIRAMLPAIEGVYARSDRPFEVVLAGHGPESVHVDALLRRNPALGQVIRYDRDYATWDDRLRPFGECDVLLYPSSHSGWGLVVPEAMAAGMMVVSTPLVEAARYFIRPGVSGVFIDPQPGAIERAMLDCLADPGRVFQMGQQARQDAVKGDARVVAQQMAEAIAKFTP